MNLNLNRVQVASRATAREALPTKLPGNRMALVSTSGEGWKIEFVDLGTLATIADARVALDGRLRDGTTSPDARYFVIRKDRPGKIPQPSELLFFEFATGELARTVSLASAFNYGIPSCAKTRSKADLSTKGPSGGSRSTHLSQESAV